MENYNGYDPYRYGLPAQPAAPTGRQIIDSAWSMLRQDRQLLALPVISTFAALVAAAILFVPGWALGSAVGGSRHAGLTVGAIAAVFAASVVGIFFQAALVIGANERAEGRTPTLSGVLRMAGGISGRIVAWAVVSTVVGTAVRALERRLGIFGSLLGFLAGLAWAIATFLAVPVLVIEGLGPIASVKRSSELVRQTWGTGLRTTLRLGVTQIVLTIPFLAALFVGVVIAMQGSTPAVLFGAMLIVVGAVGLLLLGSVFNAIYSYARTLIYRHATGRPVPGVPAQAFAGVFAPRKRRRWA